MSYPEERQYLKDQSYIAAEREMMDMQEWAEWQETMKQKPAKIIVIEEKVEETREEVV